MKKLTFHMMMIAASAFAISSSYAADDFSLHTNSDSSFSNLADRGDRGHDRGPGRGGPGRGGDHGGGHNEPGHGGGDHDGGDRDRGHDGPGWGGPGRGDDRDGPGWGRPGRPGNPGHRPRRPFIVTCGNGRAERCFMRVYIRRVELARQRSDRACRFGRTWGFDSNSIWVARGCRGDFAVYPN